MFFDSLSLLISKAAFIGLRLLTLFSLAFVLPKEVFGAISLAFTTAEICRFIADWGVDTWSLRQFSHPDLVLARTRFVQMIQMRLAASVLAFLIAWTAIGMVAPSFGRGAGTLIALLASTSLWLNISVNWLQARRRLGKASLSLFLAGTACGFVLLYMHFVRAPYVHSLAALIIFEVSIVMVLFRLAFKTEQVAPLAHRMRVFAVLKETTPIAVAVLFALAYGRLDIYFVSGHFDHKALADYSFANRLVEPVLFGAAALSSTLYARASNILQRDAADRAGFSVYAIGKIKLVAKGAALLCVLLAIVMPVLVRTFLPDYSSATVLIWIALLCTFFRCTNLAFTAIIQASGGYRTMMLISVFNGFSIITLIFVGGLAFGPGGTIAGVTLGESVNSLIQFMKVRSLTRELS
ncbi:MAG: hypothetical protein QM803_14050 [Rhodocyclaceae bacterium]